jgi:hypothetical protein
MSNVEVSIFHLKTLVQLQISVGKLIFQSIRFVDVQYRNIDEREQKKKKMKTKKCFGRNIKLIIAFNQIHRHFD